MAVRMAISLCRVEARASCRLATFAHAINSTKPTAPKRIIKGNFTSPTCASCNGTIATLSVLSIHRGLARRNRSPTTFIWARAAFRVTPGLRRPATAR